MTSPPQHDPTAVPVVELALRIRNMAGTLLLGNGESVYELSEVAEFIFRRIDGVRATHQIAGLLAQEYGIDEKEALDDTADLLAELADHRAIHFAR